MMAAALIEIEALLLDKSRPISAAATIAGPVATAPARATALAPTAPVGWSANSTPNSLARLRAPSRLRQHAAGEPMNDLDLHADDQKQHDDQDSHRPNRNDAERPTPVSPLRSNDAGKQHAQGDRQPQHLDRRDGHQHQPEQDD